MKTAVRCGWPALLPTYPSSEALTATGCPSGEWLTGKDSSGTGRRQPSLTRRGYVHVCSSWNIPDARTQHERGYGVPCGGGHRRPEQHYHVPGSGTERSWPSLELLRKTPEFSRELPASAGELNNPVSQSWRGLVLSSSPAAPGSGVNITRQRGFSLAASTRSSPSGTSMSISSNSKLKAAFTWAGQTMPAVALFSRPSRLSSSRSTRVILIRRWQPAMAHLTGTLLGIPLILQGQLKEGVSGMRARCAASTLPPPITRRESIENSSMAI